MVSSNLGVDLNISTHLQNLKNYLEAVLCLWCMFIVNLACSDIIILLGRNLTEGAANETSVNLCAVPPARPQSYFDRLSSDRDRPPTQGPAHNPIEYKFVLHTADQVTAQQMRNAQIGRTTCSSEARQIKKLDVRLGDTEAASEISRERTMTRDWIE